MKNSAIVVNINETVNIVNIPFTILSAINPNNNIPATYPIVPIVFIIPKAVALLLLGVKSDSID